MKEKKRERKPRVSFRRQLENEFRQKRSTFIVYIILRTIVIAVGVRAVLLGNYENAFLCLVTLALFLVPAFVSKTFRVDMPSLLEIVVMVFIFAAEILGEISDYYVKYPLWDTMLHTATGFLAAAMGLSLIDILNRSEKIQFHLSPLFVALVSFCFSMTIGVLWEFFEFAADALLATDMQKDTVIHAFSSVLLNPDGVNVPVRLEGIRQTAVEAAAGSDFMAVKGYLDIGLIDTMKDMFVNFIGAVVFSVFGYFYAKYAGHSPGSRLVDGLRIRKKDNPPEE